jgi:hypothetical protein
MTTQTTMSLALQESRAAGVAALQALATAARPLPPPPPTVHHATRALRFAEAAADAPGTTEAQAEALIAHMADLYRVVASTPIRSAWDAYCMLEVVADSFERGELRDGLDEKMVRAVMVWIIDGGSN